MHHSLFISLICVLLISCSSSDKKSENLKEYRIGNIELYQYTLNTIINPYELPLEIVGVVTVPPKSTKTFELGGKLTVEIKVGTTSKTIPLKPNIAPAISIMQVYPMGADASAIDLQNHVCFVVKIEDDFPGQLDIKFKGPVSVETDKDKRNTFNLNFAAFGSEEKYNEYTKDKQFPVEIPFTVTVTDKISGHKAEDAGTFIFGKW